MFRVPLIIAVLFIAVHKCFASSCSSVAFNKYAKPEKCDKDAYLYGSEIDEIDVNSKAECTANCNRNEQCNSINFEEKQTYGCELSSATPDSAGSNMDTRTGFSFYKKEDQSDDKQCSNFKGCSHLKWIEWDKDTLANRHTTQGFWSKDPLSPNDTIYFQPTYDNIKTLYLHPTEADYRADTNRISYSLPVGCDGAQGQVYGSRLYCPEHYQPRVMVFNIPDVNNYTRISFENVEGHVAGRRDQCYWHWGGYSDIDIATDEYGLWVIWGRYDQSCYLALSKINTNNQTIEKNYFFSTVSKHSHGQGFMVCGVLYVVNHYGEYPSWIKYTYNTHNDTFTTHELRGNAIIFPSKHGYNSMTNYYYNAITGERYIAVWDNAYQYKITPIMYDP